MRAAMTHRFGRELGRGPQTWTENVLKQGTYLGNPSISIAVSQYMVSLCRCKVCHHVTSFLNLSAEIIHQGP